MLHSNDLLTIETMPSWSDISLALYKEFSEQYLIPTIFRYYLENGEIIDVRLGNGQSIIFLEYSILMERFLKRNSLKKSKMDLI